VLLREAKWNIDFQGEFFGNGIDDPTLSRLTSSLSQFPRLELFVVSSKLTDRGIASLRSLDNIVSLSLAGSQATDLAVESVSGLSGLVLLDLSGTRVGDRSLPLLQGISTLRTLIVERSAISSQGIRAFQAARPDVQVYYEE
jgi:hypothetical protein